ncbi:MAG: hypothetical protein LBB88_08870 [Planctomycetaceae bacterium]|jgi:hypothetical protein|nr:hypothetical protein [Planctomycetaceae bacterium]
MQKKPSTNIDKQTPITRLLITSTKTLQINLTFLLDVFLRLIVSVILSRLHAKNQRRQAQRPQDVKENPPIGKLTLAPARQQIVKRGLRNNSLAICSRFITPLAIFGVTFLTIIFSGCSHTGVNRGHIISLEYNRPPWIGCPPDTGCDTERTCKLGHNQSSCNCNDNSQTTSGNNGKKIRRHCGLKPNCSPNHPCCETPGCGMWIDPSDPNSFGINPRMPRACGLTPFCSPMKPCGMTPNCGRTSVNPYLPNNAAFMTPYGINNPYANLNNFPANGFNGGLNSALINGLTLPSLTLPSLPITSTPVISNSPTPISTPPNVPNPNGNNNNNNNGTSPKPNPPKPATIAGPNGILVSMGIVPGVSAINGGGYVAASGVATPQGLVMTPNGIQLPNGTVNTQMVIKVCGSHPRCSPSHPCGMTPNCGIAVPVGLVSNNAAPLAAEIIARNAQNNGVVNANVIGNGGGVGGIGVGVGVGNIYNGYPNYNGYNGYNSYGNVLQVNGISPQNFRNGINYAANPNRNSIPNNFNSANINSSNYPQLSNNTAAYRTPPPLQPELSDNEQMEDENPDDENENSIDETTITNQGKKSSMPLPRFHSVPTEPTFNRRKGIPVQKISDENAINKVSQNHYKNNADTTDTTAIERAYLEGMVTALDEIENELDSQADKFENAKIKNLALEKAEKLQAKIDAKTKRDAEIAEISEFENQQKQLRELAIQAEQLKLEQQKNAKILAKRQAELDEESQNLIIEKNRLRQEQIAAINSQSTRIANQQIADQNNSNIQTANYQNTTKNNETIFASAVNFLNGNAKKQDNSESNQKNKTQKINAKNNATTKDIAKNNAQQKSNNSSNSKRPQNANQSTGTISRILSPVTNLISTSNNSKPKPLPQPSQKTKTKITNNEESNEQNLPTRPATFPIKQKRNTNNQYVVD